jgi:arylsulfatase A-like enzyme
MDYQQSPPLPIMRNEEVIEKSPAQASLTGRYTKEAVQFIEQHAGEPFFLYLAHSMPHLPIDASEKFKGESEHGLYGDVIMEIDWSVGEIMKTLKEQGIDENTLVIFTSDNGPVIRPKERLGHRPGSAGPLRGHKNTTWEGGMREPCLMRWPGKIPAGETCDEIALTMDIMPTIAKLVGGWLPQDRIIDGKDIWPLMSGQPGARTPHEAFYYYRDDRLQAVRSGKWKLHVYRPEWEPNYRHGVYDLLLYDLENDIGETTNVAKEHPEVVKRLQALAQKARNDLGDAATDTKGANIRPIGHLNEE